MEIPIKMDDLGGTTIFGNTHMITTNLFPRFTFRICESFFSKIQQRKAAQKMCPFVFLMKYWIEIDIHHLCIIYVISKITIDI